MCSWTGIVCSICLVSFVLCIVCHVQVDQQVSGEHCQQGEGTEIFVLLIISEIPLVIIRGSVVCQYISSRGS